MSEKRNAKSKRRMIHRGEDSRMCLHPLLILITCPEMRIMQTSVMVAFSELFASCQIAPLPAV